MRTKIRSPGANLSSCLYKSRMPKISPAICACKLLEISEIPYIRSGREPDLAVINDSRWFSSIPPSEWLEPFSDVSDLIESPRNLKPSPWIERVCDILEHSYAVESALDEFCSKYFVRLSPQFVSYVLRMTKIQKAPKLAFRFFNWASRQYGYQHKLASYVAVIESLGAVKDVENVRIVAAAMKANRSRFQLTASACNILIKNFGRAGMVDELLDIWHAMKEYGIQLDIFAYNCLIDGLVNSECIEAAENVLVTMNQGRVSPDVVTYNMLIKGVCKAGRVEAAIEYFREILS